MPKIRNDAPYDPTDRESLLSYSLRLKDKTLGEVCDVALLGLSSKDKGKFGSILERGYYRIEKNNENKPDFEELGIELKTTPMVRTTKKKYRPKERLSLNMIDYCGLIEKGFEGSLLKKNRELLVVFYLHDDQLVVEDRRILKVVLWTFSEEDIRVIEEDWNTIANMVLEGRAHEISCGQTYYLEAAPKGAGGGKGMKKQPYSEIKAKPRAFALKQCYVQKIWESSRDESIIKGIDTWGREKTFEELIIERFEPYVGMRDKDIMDALSIPHSKKDKGKYARMARRIMGVSGNKVEEFEKADVEMKTIRLKHNGVPKEDMSFPFFKFEEIASGSWDESELKESLDKKFLLIIFQISKSGDVFFKAAKFWNMPYADLEVVRGEWEETAKRIRMNELDNLPKKSETNIIHVRPHARNKSDTYVGEDGNTYEKKGFWLGSMYLKGVVRELCEKDSTRK